MEKEYQVIGIGNAMVDILCYENDNFLNSHDITKGIMQLIDISRAKQLHEIIKVSKSESGGSAANTIAGIAKLGGKTAYVGKVKNDYFWSCVDDICNIFDQRKLWYQDVFFKGNNVLVKKVTIDKYVPIIIDFKNIGKNFDPIQFNLLLNSEQKRKFYRRFNKFKTAFYQKNS